MYKLGSQAVQSNQTFSNPKPSRLSRRTALAELVNTQLQEKGLRQIDFCRQTGFDQGLLSKILSSAVNRLNVETTLKLAEGLDIHPVVIFEAIGKKEVDEMLRRFYANANR